MAEFINFETEAEVVEVEDGKEDDEVSNISEDSFIDDQEVGADVNFYRQFANVENDLDQVLTEAHNEALEDIEQFDEISNLCDGSDSEIQIDEFQSSEIDITKFKETLFPRVDEAQENQFCKGILYALRFDKNGNKDVCSKENFEKVIEKKSYWTNWSVWKSRIYYWITKNFKHVLWNQRDFVKIWLYPKSIWIKKQISSSENER